MYIPTSSGPPYSHSVPNSSDLVFTAGDDSQAQTRSSLIGIVTAICGNVLISFALNTQRYAHMRLSSEKAGEEEKSNGSGRDLRGSGGGNGSYGTVQEAVAERRAGKNAGGSGASGKGDYSLQDEGESQPLIPRERSLQDDEEGEDGEGEEEQGGQKEKSYLKSPYWWLGIGMMTVGEAGNFLAYGFAPASIVSPLGVVALVSNCLIAPLMLHETFRWRDGLGVLVAIGGCVTVVLSASDSNPRLGPNKIWHLITRWEFETYLGITIFLIVVLSFLSNKYGHKTIMIDIGLVGLYGGYTALSTKGVASLLSNTIWRVVTFPITYLLVVVLVFTAVMQIKYVNRALQRFNATMVIPTQFVMFTISVIVGSAILYRDFERQDAGDAAKFVGGCALTFFGVWCITSGRDSGEENEENEGEEEEEDAVDLVDEEGVQPEIRERDASPHQEASFASSQGERKPIARRSDSRKSSTGSPPVTPKQKPTAASTPTPLFSLNENEAVSNQAPTENVSAANLSSIHTKSTSDLPQDDGKPRAGQAPPMHATTSMPVIPTLHPSPKPAAGPPRTPLNRNTTTPSSSRDTLPTTPQSQRRRASQAHLDPSSAAAPSTGGSNRIISRQSIAGILPGPLMSPLSSSLSAIVADSLRRGNPPPNMRQRSSYRRAPLERNNTATSVGSRRVTAPMPKRHSITSGEVDFADENQTPVAVGSVEGRSRSFSATLGDFFTSKTKSKGDDEEGRGGEGRR
ncbi:hypothetical protein MBLNU230_g8033t1 [Neophaeotheca triangularis]